MIFTTSLILTEGAGIVVIQTDSLGSGRLSSGRVRSLAVALGGTGRLIRLTLALVGLGVTLRLGGVSLALSDVGLRLRVALSALREGLRTLATGSNRRRGARDAVGNVSWSFFDVEHGTGVGIGGVSTQQAEVGSIRVELLLNVFVSEAFAIAELRARNGLSSGQQGVDDSLVLNRVQFNWDTIDGLGKNSFGSKLVEIVVVLKKSEFLLIEGSLEFMEISGD